MDYVLLFCSASMLHYVCIYDQLIGHYTWFLVHVTRSSKAKLFTCLALKSPQQRPPRHMQQQDKTATGAPRHASLPMEAGMFPNWCEVSATITLIGLLCSETLQHAYVQMLCFRGEMTSMNLGDHCFNAAVKTVKFEAIPGIPKSRACET
jgi:hypothetical protein